jgi:hypothetical protein
VYTFATTPVVGVRHAIKEKESAGALPKRPTLERGLATLLSVVGAVVELTTTQQDVRVVPQEAMKPPEVTIP